MNELNETIGATLESNKDNLVIFDFWAEWCGPCKALKPALEAASSKYSKVKIFGINIDKNNDITRHHDISAIPTLIFYHGGKLVERMIGCKSQSEIEKQIQKYVKYNNKLDEELTS